MGGAQVTTSGPVQNPGYSSEWLSWPKAQDTVLRSGTHAVIKSGISTAINGGSLKDNLGSALVSEGFDLAAAVGNKSLGDFADYMELSNGSAEKVFLHAILGGALSAARGGDFKTGALAGAASEGLTAGATENLSKYLDSQFATNDQFKVGTAQIVGIMAGATVDGDPETASWVAGNAQRYNDMMHIDGGWGAASGSLGEKMVKDGANASEVSTAIRSQNHGDGYEGWMPANALVQAWSMMVGLPLAAIEAPAVGVGSLAMGGLISGGANFSYQLSTGKPINYTDLSIAGGVGALTQGKGFFLTQGYGLSGSYLGSLIKGEDPTYPLLGTAVGGSVGFIGGKVITNQLKPYIGSSSEILGNTIGGYGSEVINGTISAAGEKK